MCAVLSCLIYFLLNAICIDNSLFARLILYPVFCIVNGQARAGEAVEDEPSDRAERTYFALNRLPNLLGQK